MPHSMFPDQGWNLQPLPWKRGVFNHRIAKEVPEFFVLIQIFDPFYTQSTSGQWWIESVNQLKYVSRGVDKRMI